VTHSFFERPVLDSPYEAQRLHYAREGEGQPIDVPSLEGRRVSKWLVSLMRYDLGYIDLEQRTLQTIDSPLGTRLSPMS
jgi:hypothetical protein